MASTMRRCITYSFGAAQRYCSTQAVKPAPQLPKSKDSTVDSSDVKHHSGLYERWWSLDGPVRALHTLNELRVPLVRDGLVNVGWKDASPAHPLEGLKILDVGCGGGILSEALARIGATVTGIDMSKELIETAKVHATLDPTLSGRLTYLNTSIEDYVSTNAGVHDAIVASEIVEHVFDQELFLKCCRDSVKPGGSVFITTWNRTLSSYLAGILCAEYILRIIPLGTHHWSQFIRPEETQRILEKYGCRSKLLHGMFFNPVANRWSWQNSTAVSYALHMVRNAEEEE